jgi:hypothetical protein
MFISLSNSSWVQWSLEPLLEILGARGQPRYTNLIAVEKASQIPQIVDRFICRK